MKRHDVKEIRGKLNRSGKSKWELALADAELRLAEAKQQVRKLEVAIQTCRERVEKKAPWPGESATQN